MQVSLCTGFYSSAQLFARQRSDLCSSSKKHIVEKHKKPFVVIYLIICSSPSKWFCTGPRGCAGEHSLHYLAGQSLRSPCVFGPEDSVRLKISPQVRTLFSLISDISEYANFFSDARFCWKGIIVYWRICCTLMSKKKTIIHKRIVKTADAER